MTNRRAITSEEHAIAKSIFLKAIEHEGDERNSIVDAECGGNDVVRLEVLSLLSHHDQSGSPSHKTDTDLTSDEYGTKSEQSIARTCVPKFLKSKRGRGIVTTIILVTIIFSGKRIHDNIEDTYRRELGSQLQVVLNSSAQSVNLWADRGFNELHKWADDPELCADVLKMVHNSNKAHKPDEFKSLQAQLNTPKRIEAWLKTSNFRHYAIIDFNYTLLATDLPLQLGERFSGEPAIVHAIKRLRADKRVLLPRRSLESAADFAKEPNVPFEHNSAFALPVHDKNGTPIGAIAFLIDAEKNFDPILAIGRWGDTGETYAVSANGLLLSSSRFAQDLYNGGLLSRDTPLPLNLQIRNPGPPDSQGHYKFKNADVPPFTTAAQRLIAASENPITEPQEGVILTPYHDYRGNEVIGAWRWDRELNFGLITEIDSDEALATIHYFSLAIWILFAIASIAIFAVLLSSFSLIQLRQKVKLGSRIGQYKLIKRLGEGALGEVFLATHQFLKRPTAIKFLKPNVVDRETLSRFELEVRLTCKLSHPNTVAIYDFGRTSRDRFYYIMEYLPGISLAKLLEVERKLPENRAIYILKQIAASLIEAHDVGLLHRDIKPLNIMICRIGGEFDFVKVVDFGLAKNLKSSIVQEITLEQPHLIRGTPLYMAPERVQGTSIQDPRSDIYSFGVVAYRMITGQKIFNVTNDMALLYDIMNTQPKSIRSLCPEISEELATLIMQCLEKKMDMRPASMKEIRKRLETCSNTQPWTPEAANEWWSHRDHLFYGAT